MQSLSVQAMESNSKQISMKSFINNQFKITSVGQILFALANEPDVSFNTSIEQINLHRQMHLKIYLHRPLIKDSGMSDLEFLHLLRYSNIMSKYIKCNRPYNDTQQEYQDFHHLLQIIYNLEDVITFSTKNRPCAWRVLWKQATMLHNLNPYNDPHSKRVITGYFVTSMRLFLEPSSSITHTDLSFMINGMKQLAYFIGDTIKQQVVTDLQDAVLAKIART